MVLSLCGQYQANDVVCPTHWRKGLFTVGAMDNIDHNASSTTADSSFHGTGISIIQFPTASNTCTAIEPVSTTATKGIILPQSYAVVPAVVLNQSRAAVMERICENITGNLVDGMLQEIKWLNNSLDLLQSNWESNKPMTWASFHASFQLPCDDTTCDHCSIATLQ